MTSVDSLIEPVEPLYEQQQQQQQHNQETLIVSEAEQLVAEINVEATAAPTEEVIETSNQVRATVAASSTTENQTAIHPEDVDLFMSSINHPYIKKMQQQQQEQNNQDAQKIPEENNHNNNSNVEEIEGESFEPIKVTSNDLGSDNSNVTAQAQNINNDNNSSEQTFETSHPANASNEQQQLEVSASLIASEEVTIVDETKTSDCFSSSQPQLKFNQADQASAETVPVPAPAEPVHAPTSAPPAEDEYSAHEVIIQQTNDLKDQAKVYVTSRQFKEAIYLYEQSLRVLNSITIEVGSDKKRFTKIVQTRLELTLMILCNLSLCHFNDGNYEASLDFGQRVALIDPNHLKAAYRRALALKKLDQIEKAFDEIKNARLIAIGQRKTDEQINKEYTVIKLLFQEKNKAAKLAASSLQSSQVSQNLSKNQQPLGSSGTLKKSSKFTDLSNSAISNVSSFVGKNFQRDSKKSPYFAICSAVTSFIVLKRFISIDLVTKPALISAPILTAGFYGVFQGRNALWRIVSGSIIGIIAFVLFRITKASLTNQTAIAL